MKRTLAVDQKVAYCTYIIQTKLLLKNQRYPQKFMFTATGGPTDTPLVVLHLTVMGVRSSHPTRDVDVR